MLCPGLSLVWRGATRSCSVQASHRCLLWLWSDCGCSKHEILVAAARGLGNRGSRALEFGLSSCGPRPFLHGLWDLSQTWDRTRVLCICRRILEHCITGEVLKVLLGEELHSLLLLLHFPRHVASPRWRVGWSAGQSCQGLRWKVPGFLSAANGFWAVGSEESQAWEGGPPCGHPG